MDTYKPIISITHNDLDGVGCQVIIRWSLQDVYYKAISYNKIHETLLELEDVLTHDRNKTKVIISDLSLKPKELLLLQSIAKNNPDVKFIYADHHLRNEAVRDIYNNMPKNFIDLYDVNKCSAYILYYYYGVNNNRIRDFIEKVNSYDMWLNTSDNFLESLILNEIYENMSHFDFFNNISYYGVLREDITRKIKKTHDKINSIENNIPDNEMIYYNDNIAISHIDKNKSIVQHFLNRPINVIISSNFNFSIRLSNSLTDVEYDKYKEIFFDFFKHNGYEYYHAHKQVFGFNSNTNNILSDVDKFVTFVNTKIN